MADPWTRTNPPVTWPYGAGGASGDHVTSLANNTVLGLGYLNNSTLTSPYGDIILPTWKITTGAGSVSGTIQRWLVVGEATSMFTGGLDPTSASDLTSALNAYLITDPLAQAAMLLDTINVSAAGTAYYFRWRSLYAFIGNVPTYVGLLIQNLSGVALSTTAGNHITNYVIDSYV
jgi:hypothetical protein